MRAARAVALLCLAIALAGCSLLPSRSDPEPAPSPAANAASGAARAAYRLEIDAPSNLRELLTAYLDLSRFRSAPQTESITSAELDRLIVAVPAQARGLLETEGYFQAQISATKQPGSGDDLPVVQIAVTPGPRTLVAEVNIDARGPLAEMSAAGDHFARERLHSFRTQWPLPAGQPFRQAAWNSAKNVSLARLRAGGYAAASWASTAAHVDVPTQQARLQLTADSGPLYRLGPVRIEGLQRYGEASVRRLATFAPGTPYSEKLLLDYQERLQKLGLFASSSVEIEADPSTADAAPVLIRVREQPLQEATFGAGYSANTGPRVSVEHLHRNVFGTDWISHNKIETGPRRTLWEGELTSHPLEDLYRNLVAGTAERLRSGEEVRTSWNVRVGRTQDTPRIERLYFTELVHARVASVAGYRDDDAVSLNYHWILRALDNVLLPTDGFSLSLQSAGGYARSSTAHNGPFVRAYARATGYQPLPGGWYGTLRFEAGQVFAKLDVGVPDTLLFRAGGDESVRGYAYRTLGPLVNGVATSGRVLFTGSAEVARPILSNRPEFWWAAFVDAGNAAARWTELDPQWGYGLGLRWRSPVGPLRVDLAYGQQVQRLRLHVSVGIAF